MGNRHYDVFISHASEDKDFARRLAHRLEAAGLKVWFDDFVLELGDSLRECIDKGLRSCKYGVVVLSPAFFLKRWPQVELNALFSRESTSKKIILPVWHQIDSARIAKFSAVLADRLAVFSDKGVESVALAILQVISNSHDQTRWKLEEVAFPNETAMVVLPLHPVGGKAILMSKYLVTNRQYQNFIMKTGAAEPVGDFFDERNRCWKGGFHPWRERDFSAPDQPVVCISFDEAVRYCQWLSSSTYPPTYKIWDFAALGGEFSFGSGDFWFNIQPSVHHRNKKPAPVDITGARQTNTGFSDMFGNVWEWCSGLRPYRVGLMRHIKDFTAGIGAPALPPPPLVAVLSTPRKPSSPNHNVRQYAPDEQLRGAGFLDDLSYTDPFLHVSEITNKHETRHSDLGFRVSAFVNTKDLPPSVQKQLALCRISTERFLPSPRWYLYH
jgi:hypothetical protein